MEGCAYGLTVSSLPLYSVNVLVVVLAIEYTTVLLVFRWKWVSRESGPSLRGPPYALCSTPLPLFSVIAWTTMLLRVRAFWT